MSEDTWSVVLCTSDDKRVPIKHSHRDRVLQHFATLNAAIPEDMKQPGMVVEIPVYNVQEDAMLQMLAFSEHHHENFVQMPVKMTAEIEAQLALKWNEDFIKGLSDDLRVRMTHGANYLQYKYLFSTLCYMFAQEFKNATVEETRARFGLVNDLSPEEEEYVKKGLFPPSLEQK